MKRSLSMLVAVALGMAACADAAPSDEPAAKEDNQALGNLTLNLLGADSDGRQYRLRNGVFGIYGSPEFGYPYPLSDGGSGYSQSVSTETDPEAPLISLRVVPGQYYINLESQDWYLERQSAGSWERVAQAVLLSSAYQYAYVYDGGVTSVAFRFGVDGELIDFRSGELQVGIEIEQPGEGPGYPDAGGVFGGGDGGFIGGGMFGGLGGGFGGGDASVPTPSDAGSADGGLIL
jgi:hypothetical protein